MDASITRPSNRLKQCNDPESSAALHSAYGKPECLHLGLKVFLSHSGADKDFVRRLYREIRTLYYGIEVAFFDEESIQKGKAVNMDKSILEEVRNSELGVLVITDDFFMQTPNPMLELEAFVAGNVKLLPLFLKMSVNEFKQQERWNTWEKQWKKWAARNDKLKIDKWRSYLSAVSSFNGLEFCKIAPNGREDLYIDEVVRQVAFIIGPVVPMIGKNVYGKDRLCKVIDNMYKKCSSKRSSLIDYTATWTASTSSSLGLEENSGFYAYNVVGIHGFSGLGKTTLSKCLCDYYFKNMKGSVCYIDLGLSSETKRSRMQHVLSRLDRRNCKNISISQLDDNQVENLVEERLSSMQDPVFLAVDNIPPEGKSQQEALIYLRCKFPEGSKIFITSRDERTLSQLIDMICRSCSFRAVIEYMPKLINEEAREIFKHGFPDLHNFWHSNLSENIQRDIDACVHMCTIFNGKRYHPLMIKSLVAYVSWDRSKSNLNWKERLAKLAAEGNIVDKDNAWEEVYQLFDITYELLTKEEKKVFLDLSLSYYAISSRWYEWIHALHVTLNLKEERLEKILLRLHSLCFMELNEPKMKIHDLMVEFGKHKAGADISDRYFVLEDAAQDWLGASDFNTRPVRHVNISRCKFRTLDLKDVEGVTVLHLLDNAGPAEVLLSRTSSAHLRSLIVRVPAGTVLRCVVDKDWSSQSLTWLQIEGDFNIGLQPALERSLMLPNARVDPGCTFWPGGFRSLQHFKLTSDLPSVVNIDLTTCANLKLLHVSNMPGLKSIRGQINESSSHFTDVSIINLPDLEELAFTVTTHEDACFQSTKNTGFFKTGLLRAVSVIRCPQVKDLSSLGQWRSLHSLTISRCKSVEVCPDVAAMSTSLWQLDLSHNTSLREWPRGVHLLRGLVRLNLSGCPQVPAKEVLLKTITLTHPWNSAEIYLWAASACTSLIQDLKFRRRDRCTVAVALGEVSVELAAFFDRWWPRKWEIPGLVTESRIFSPRGEQGTDVAALLSELRASADELADFYDHQMVNAYPNILESILRLIYEVLFQGVGFSTILCYKELFQDLEQGRVSANGQEQDIVEHILIALLSTESFLSLPFRACRRCGVQRKRWTFFYTGAVIGALGVYTVLMTGRASSTDSHRAHHLRGMTVLLVRSVIVFLIKGNQGSERHTVDVPSNKYNIDGSLELLYQEVVREELEVGLRGMAREAGLEVEEGSPESQQPEELRDRADVEAQCSLLAAQEIRVLESDFISELEMVDTAREIWSLFDSFDSQTYSPPKLKKLMNEYTADCSFLETDREVVGEEVEVGLRRMAGEAGLEVEEGSPESQQLEELRERAVESLCTLVAGNPDTVKVGDIVREMRALWSGRWPVASELSEMWALWNKRWPFPSPLTSKC